MKRSGAVWLFLAVWLFVLACAAPAAERSVPPVLDGEGWTAIPSTWEGKTQKASYLRGLYEGAAFIDRGRAQEILYGNLTDRRSLIAALDQFYGDYKNIKIPVPYALVIVSQELNGTAAGDIEQHLRQLRQEFSR